MNEHPEPDIPRDDPDLEAALRDPAFDDVPPDAVPDDPARPEDIAPGPDAPHLGLERDQAD